MNHLQDKPTSDFFSSLLERFNGDALKVGDVAAALDGVDVVVQAIGVPVKDLLGPATLFSDATTCWYRPWKMLGSSAL